MGYYPDCRISTLKILPAADLRGYISYENKYQWELFQNKVHWIFGCCASQYAVVNVRCC